MTADELYRRAISAANPKVRAALLRAWHRAKTRPDGDAARPADMPPSHYAALCRAIRTCTACPLARTRTQAVPGEGPIPSRVMLIGEGPGEQEDKMGRPFVGPAGRLLDELLASIGWSRGDVYIANTVACRPPGNRQPRSEEVAACRGHVLEQLVMVEPTVIVTLGGTALSWFDPRKRISLVHGRPFRSGLQWVFPTYHPAAALHNPSLRQELFDDFRRLAKLTRAVRYYTHELQLLAGRIRPERTIIELDSAAVGASVWLVPQRTGQPRYEITYDELRDAITGGHGEQLVSDLQFVEHARQVFRARLVAFRDVTGDVTGNGR